MSSHFLCVIIQLICIYLFQLFDHIAECIHKFMKDHSLLGHKIPLGFTFSFPCKQKGLNKAILTHWTKGFKCSGVEGEDIVQLLHNSIKKRGVGFVVCFLRNQKYLIQNTLKFQSLKLEWIKHLEFFIPTFQRAL